MAELTKAEAELNGLGDKAQAAAVKAGAGKDLAKIARRAAKNGEANSYLERLMSNARAVIFGAHGSKKLDPATLDVARQIAPLRVAAIEKELAEAIAAKK